MKIASQTGSPIMRPMFYDYYDDEVCYTLEDQYMFGEDILVAPITQKGQVERNVYLPEGVWISINDKASYNGKQWIRAHAEISEYIAFIKEGSDLVTLFFKGNHS